MKMNITAVYFSATGNSKKCAVTIAKYLDPDMKEIDLTMWDSTPKKDSFDANDLVIFSGPVYGGRMFAGAAQRFSKLRGKHTPCILLATYGNRHYDDALLELSDIVTKNGFVPVAAAALVGEHTYGTIQIGRPNEEDLTEDTAFAEKVSEKLKNQIINVIVVPGNRPYREGAQNGGKFRPLTNEKCVKCGLCAKMCPQGAISKEDYCTIDTDKCISCFRCIKSCPVKAKNMDTPDYQKFAEDFSKKLEKRLENKYYL
jgi:ferredoxin